MRRSSRVLWPVLVVIAMFCGGSAASGKCLNETYEMTIREAIDATKLPDGEHVVASVPTKHGPLEARVTVKNRKAIEGNLFFNGKPMRPILSKQLPAHTRACLKKSRGGSAGADASGTLLAAVAEGPASGECFYDKFNKLYFKVGRGCRENVSSQYEVVDVEGEGDSTTYVVAIIQNGRVCGYGVV